MDLDNDGKAREVLPQFGGKTPPTAWYEARNGKFEKHVVSTNSYGHGIGAGDVNGDGRNDILTPKGWFEAPPTRAGDWKFHPDFDLESHRLHVRAGRRRRRQERHRHRLCRTTTASSGCAQNPDGKWSKPIMIDDSWSQPHAVTMVDVNGDGRMDFVTGKRFMAHNGKDPGEREPLGVYWFEYLKPDGKQVEWVKHVLDYGTRTGGGMQIAVADLNGDGAPDIATPGKSGLFLFENLSKKR